MKCIHFSFLSFSLIVAAIFTACDNQGDYSDVSWSTITSSIIYKVDATNQYEVAFGNYTESELGNVLDKDLTAKLKVWLVKDSLNKELQIDTLLTLQRKAHLSFIQLAPGGPIQIYNQPEFPDSTSAMRVQLFYASASQPDSVLISIVAVDRYNFIATAKSDFTKANPLDTVTTFTLRRNKLSQAIDLDLNRFRGGTNGYEALFYYSVRNATTGAMIQALNKNVQIKVTQISSSSADRFRAKYKLALMQFPYLSAQIPLNVPTSIVTTNW